MKLSCLGVLHMARNDLQGSLALLVLRALSQMDELQGYGIVLHIEQASHESLPVEQVRSIPEGSCDSGLRPPWNAHSEGSPNWGRLRRLPSPL